MTERENTPADAATEKPVRRRSTRVRQVLLWTLIPAAVLAGGAWYLISQGRFESTDNAYLNADIISIAPEVAGRVVAVEARENQHVNAGDVLFRIDAQPYELAVAELNAQALAISDYLNSSRDSYAAALADLSSKDAYLKHELQLYHRIEDLYAKGVASQEDLDDATNSVATARADRDAASAMAAKAKTLLGGDSDTPNEQLAAYQMVQARLARAQLDLSRAVVRAPIDGVIGKMTLQVGDYVNVGQVTLPLVTENIWVDANFKETQMTWVREGQKAMLSVDAYPGQEWQAEVVSLSPASSGVFSVLPAQNATGNWVKIVQRIPVRLRILSTQTDDVILRAGMSAVVRIDTGRGHTLADRWLGTRADDVAQTSRSGEARK